MFHISNSAASLRDAESILSSEILNEEERVAMLEAVLSSIPANSIPHMQIARTALTRKLGELHGKAKGLKEQAEVVEGSGSEEGEASEGSPEGFEDQADDVGPFNRPHGRRKRRTAKAPTKT